MLIVSGPEEQAFAAVGSGNLSAGGFRDNVECGLFTNNPAMVSELSKWFDNLYESLSVKLKEKIISGYEPLLDKDRARSEQLVRRELVDLSGIDREAEASLKGWNKAASHAKTFFNSSQFLENGRSIATRQVGSELLRSFQDKSVTAPRQYTRTYLIWDNEGLRIPIPANDRHCLRTPPPHSGPAACSNLTAPWSPSTSGPEPSAPPEISWCFRPSHAALRRHCLL